MKKMLSLLLAGVTSMGLAFNTFAEEYITLASTTSTENSGLFDAIVPKFEDATGIKVRVVAVGTGQAFEIARRGDADSLLVHDTSGEQRFIENGHASERADVMYNDFVLIGPADDPARISGTQSATEAFAAIADAEATFTSRGDDSGTNRAELRLWQNAGVDPDGDWYRELGSGMGPTLNTAAAMDAYVMSDRATWVAFGNRQNLTLLFEGDDVLFNQYGSLLLSEDKHPHLKHGLARQWHNWLISDDGQQAIAEFRVKGQQLFFPNAK
ncbi:substrate-binding domain-containing protein [Marinobacter sp. TBZ242]|uniref:Substrate-binding domain-containing protein n=1 Tax=Marinobacter azerbaijanicus TaxID=3050455 RepID=A0ABT7IBX9_9GAMM|nr:substrate-binding domain-containing protein [Marinobacter sp. TBZ242]MDL0431657.1 substrate-binding domain-containing protein [Marinobacter sp. TBZ242]